MRKFVMAVSAVALFAAGLFVGSRPTLVGSRASTASVIVIPSNADASEADITLSPLKMMIESKRALPEDKWHDLF